MNTIGDIWKLWEVGDSILRKAGLEKSVGVQFDKRMNELLVTTYIYHCMSPEQIRDLDGIRANFPQLEFMADSLRKFDQLTLLDRMAQGRYYCAVAFLIMMAGRNMEDLIAQQDRVNILISIGVLSSLE